MKTLLTLLLGLLAFVGDANAADMPCVQAWNLISTHLTYNQGCEGTRGKLCSEFLTCIHQFQICVRSGERVFGGNSVREIQIDGKSIDFGINQTFTTKQRRYCVLASAPLVNPDDRTDPGWHYWTFTPNTGSTPVAPRKGKGDYKNISEFMASTADYFNDSIAWLRGYLKSGDFKDGEFGYNKGEEP